ncbi:hypothetical protein C3747_274g21 [Trypanosoma cruzi]|uniref:Uncharacterized protein n=2 Tax=Trypanosoma cruzi TaxID=5693 RepID=Q4DD95_TRYCC|nr:hypothetical protein, conserved [Trypanosoma cruzi]EAN90497.1 hypothetical protein, conserved [Trypanosoma cruzi]KAF5220336.1 hypothetical protein ECC02_006640 [Trypanosoma cruzi]PWU94838.1 hypothetical protein C3747_274g21 [Trypanosoma cruzi]RNC50845.1 hypothetical protein TcCL_ESM12096 [Trypanosoma cruzi]|eukprot:XP_812348.1 hypothetical protein [Trypanosoma cruzi strain CL Brener]
MVAGRSKRQKRVAATATAVASATNAATPALRHSSRQIEEFTQQLMDAMAHASVPAVCVLQPSTSSSEEREEEGNRPSHSNSPVAAPAFDEHNGIKITATSPPRCLQGGATSRLTAECSLRGREARLTPRKSVSHPGHGTPLRASSIQTVCAHNNSNNPVGPGDVSRTEAEVLQQHGPLSQLNSLYAVREGDDTGSSTSSHNSTVDDVNDAGGREVGEGDRERRVYCRRRELLEIPPGSLSLYTRLAECGVNALDRPFATCVVRRAQGVMEAWAAGFL